MNVFVLCTGRCGSMTFSEACKHIKNYTSSHESKNHLFGKERLNYPNNHIEVDNRLSWFLGSMDKKYGNDAYYVHLKRDTLNVAKSYLERWEFGITKSYHNGIILGIDNNSDYNKLDVCVDMCNTINNNIELFLKDKTKKMTINIETAKDDFVNFCNDINVAVNMDNAISEFNIKYNFSK